MKMRLLVLLVLCLALWGAQTYGRQHGQQPANLDVMKVKDDLYVIYNIVAPGNTTALITSDGVVLVDDKFEVDHANLMAQLAKVTSQPIRYVINTTITSITLAACQASGA
jgi:hypothetical protein